METAHQPKFHRAWLVFGGMCVYYFVAYGLLYSGFGLFLTPMSEDLGIPYVQLAITTTVRVLAGMVTTAFIGVIFPRVRLRRFLGLVLLGLAVTILLVPVSSRMWQFLLVFAAMGLFCGLTLYGIVPMILNQWFQAPAALITIASACGSAGGIILCPMLSQVISHWGWRTGYYVMAALVLAVMLPIALLLFDFNPHAQGVKALANRGKQPAAVTESELARSGKPAPRSVYILCALFFLVGALAGGMYIHISSALYSKGFAAIQVSLLVSCFQAGSTLLQFIPGMLSTRLGLRPILAVILPLTALGAVVFIFLTPHSPFVITLLMVLLMGGGRMFTALNSLLARYLFGHDGFHQAYPRLQSIYLIGTAFTSVIYGGIYSATGSYDGTLWLMAGCMAAMLLMTQIMFHLVDHRKIIESGGTKNVI